MLPDHMVKMMQNAVYNGYFHLNIPIQFFLDTLFVIKGTNAVKIVGITRKGKRKKGSFLNHSTSRFKDENRSQ